MGTIRFELRAEKKDKEGKAPLRLIYQIRGQRKYYNTGQKTFLETWDTAQQKVIYLDKKAAKKLARQIDYNLLPTSKEAEELNGKLKDFIKDIQTIEKRFELDKIIYSAEMVLNKLTESKAPTTKKEAPSKFLFDFIDKYIIDHKETRKAGSLTVYRTLKKHLQDFQRYTRKQVTFDKIDYSFFQSFQNFLITGTGTTTDKKGQTVRRTPLNNTSTAKQLSTVISQKASRKSNSGNCVKKSERTTVCL